MKMKHMMILAWVLLFVTQSFTSVAQQGSKNWCTNNNYSRLFNVNTIEELTGTIVSIDKITPEAGMSVGIHLIVKTIKNEQISVHLGPAWYIDNQNILFAPGDVITVKGSKISYQNAPAIIAMSVEKEEHLLILRDKKGNPAWNGWRKGKKGARNRMNN